MGRGIITERPRTCYAHDPLEMIRWDAIDTVLLDMDGTLLDLHYDNMLWNELLPARYGAARSLSLEAAQAALFERMKKMRGSIQFYCTDQWSAFTGLDVAELHHELVELICYRPNAERFLGWLRANGKRSLLVTNAHRDSLRVKHLHTGVIDRLDVDVSCHDYGAPKESAEFWARLQREHPFDPARTLFIDDNASVLDAAARFGIQHLFTITRPDSARPPRPDLAYPAFDDFAELLPLSEAG
jgi:HAD superfamily hydrolase (TIGR01509 family)